MILDRSIVEAPCFKSFLHLRRLLRNVQNQRILISSQLCSINHAIARYEIDGTVFDKHRINTLKQMRSDLAQHMQTITSPLDGMELSFYNMLMELSELTTAEQRAHILGNTPAWLDKQDPDWRENGLFEMIFVNMAESERHDMRRHGVPPLLWYCSRLISKVPRDEIMSMILKLKDKIHADQKPRLRLVKS